MNELIILLKLGEYQKFLMTLGGILGASFSFVVGGMDVSIKWLIILCIVDYISGMVAAFKSGEWSSRQGFKGIVKKVIMFSIVGICVALDTISKMSMLRNIVIFAYALNEAGSILENIDRMGMGGLIPPVIKKGIKQLKEKNEEKEVDKK